MPETVFSISSNSLTNLDQNHAVEYLRRLLGAESIKLGISQNLVKVPSAVNVADGGIDASIEGAAHSVQSFIPQGNSGFQVKAVRAADFAAAACKAELHVEGDITKPLKPQIEALLQSGGKYFLVLFDSLTPPMRQRREDGLAEEFTRLGYSRDKFEIIDVDQLITFGEIHPPVVSWINPNSNYGKSLAQWAENTEISFPVQYHPDDRRTEIIETIRETIRIAQNCAVVRVVGLSGLGKSRTVFEALSIQEFQDAVLYVEAPEFLPTPLWSTLQADKKLHAIIVVDECNLEQHRKLVSNFSGQGKRLALITISNTFGDVPPPTTLFNIFGLEKEKVKQLLVSEFRLPSDIADRLAEFADGYPGMAALLAGNYASSTETHDEFIRLSDQALINRLISGDGNTATDSFAQTKKVLTSAAIFSKIGYRDKGLEELRWLCKHSGIRESDFRTIIEAQRRRGLVEGEYYISVKPFMLRATLFTEWWESMAFDHQTFDEFLNSIPEAMRPSLINRLIDNIPYLGATVRGQAFIKSVLSATGLFADESLLESRLGADFFLKLTEADAGSGLDYLKRTVGRWSKEKLLQFDTGRQEVVWALEKITVWNEHFADGAQLLLKLGSAENARASNNATGTFADLFSPAPGRVAPTEAPLSARFPVLQKAFNSSENDEVKVAIAAIEKALETDNFTRAVGAEHQGFRKEPDFWRPKTNQEFIDYFSQVWQLSILRLSSLEHDNQEKLVSVLVDQSGGLLRFIPDMVLESLKQIGEASLENKKKVIEALTRILHYQSKGLPVDLKAKIETLKQELIGNDFSSQIKRYAGMQLFEDEYDEDGNPTNVREQKVAELAAQAIANPAMLEPELAWLTTGDAQNGYEFGYHLGSLDDKSSLFPRILETMKASGESAADYFIGGYLKAKMESDSADAEGLIERLSKDDSLYTHIIGIIWRSGITEKTIRIAMQLGKEGKVLVEDFSIFCYGSVVENLSEEVFTELVEFLYQANTAEATIIALDLVDFYYRGRKKGRNLPKDLTFRLLTHQKLGEAKTTPARRRAEDYNWVQLSKAFVNEHPQDSLPLGIMVLDNLGKDGTIFEDYRSTSLEILDLVAKIFPAEIWKHIIELIGPPIDGRARNITDWLHGHKVGFDEEENQGGISHFSEESIFSWVDEDVEKRAWYIADFSPRILFREDGKTCFARETLVRYGDRKDVRNELQSNFWSGGFSGPGSLHYQKKVDMLKAFKEEESDPNVLLWLDEFIASLEQFVESEKMDEELRGF